jgi:hypothetical protein
MSVVIQEQFESIVSQKRIRNNNAGGSTSIDTGRSY